MCTVSYLPIEDGYILTTNRDEDPRRETFMPRSRILANGTQLMAPIDAEKGGTWIAVDSSGRCACVINGALANHERTPPYRMSRGQLILDAFGATDFNAYIREANPEGMEPFTLLLIDPGKIQRWVWDGRHSHQFEPAADQIHLWSSATLYSREQHAAKEAYFRNALESEGQDRESLLKIHGMEGHSPFILDRPDVRTTSITQVALTRGCIDLTYFQNEAHETARITLPAAV